MSAAGLTVMVSVALLFVVSGSYVVEFTVALLVMLPVLFTVALMKS